MDLRSPLVRLLLAVVDAGSIDAAAKDNTLSPSSVLASLRRLDDELGFSVLQDGLPLELTDAGELFIAEVRRLDRDLIEIEHLLAQPDRSSGRISMALQPGLATVSYGVLASGFFDLLPTISVSLMQVPTAQAALTAVRQGAADTAFVSLVRVPPGFATVTFGSIRLVLVLPKSWASVQGLSVLREFGEFPFIEGRLGAAHDWTLDALRQAGVRPRPVVQNVPVSLVAQLVLAGVGAALVPELLADVLHKQGCQVISDAPALDVPIHLVRRDGIASDTVEALFDAARRVTAPWNAELRPH